ncbi:hypothetical protein BDY24DRAFT_372811 [Mrakia frigida]|uniref:uncharacterized protein n=1 Tax=Mrakia frigida TaxID=29902 RepID=UPI003FCC183C
MSLALFLSSTRLSLLFPALFLLRAFSLQPAARSLASAPPLHPLCILFPTSLFPASAPVCSTDVSLFSKLCLSLNLARIPSHRRRDFGIKVTRASARDYSLALLSSDFSV